MRTKTEEEKKLKVLLWDIETTHLKANYGYMLCIGWKWLDEPKVHHVKINDSPSFKKDPTNDRYLIEEFRKVLEQADVVVYHYGMYFDYPYLQTRALIHGLRPLPNVPAVDTWRIARKNLALNSNSLKTITEVISGEEKTPLDMTIWVRAMAGHTPSIDYVVKHCVQDVVVLEQVYKRLMAFRKDGVKLSTDGCPSCGSHKVQKRGVYKTVKKLMHRFMCSACGRWFNK